MVSVSLSRTARRRVAACLSTLLLGTVGWLPAPCPEMGESADGAHHGVATSHPGPDAVGAHAHRAAEPDGDATHPHPSAHVGNDDPAGTDSHDELPPCAMMGHCTTGLPGEGLPADDLVAVVTTPGPNGPAWSVHAAPPTHVTPPPKR